MTNVVADPDKLRDLAKKMNSAGQQLEALRAQLMKALQATEWNDRERQKFEQELTADLKRAVAVAQRLQTHYPPMLQRKAKALDDFRR
jgi:hypothetical protein